MNQTATVALAAAVPTALLVVCLVLVWRSRRRLHRRIHLATARLAHAPVPDTAGVEETLAALERVIDSTVAAGGESSAAERRMTHALSIIDDGIVLLDEQGRIVFRNAAARSFLGARHGEALVETAIESLSRRALDGSSDSETLELFGPPRRVLVLGAAPLDDGHRSIGALVVIEDMTERRRVDAVRRDFVANISHELKTPVGGLGVLAETLVDENDLGIVRRLATRIHHEAMRASRTIDDLLELTRIEAGEAAMRDPVPVHLVLAEAIERAATGAEQSGIAVHLDEPARRLEVLGDRRQLVSAVFNLLDNAIKYSQPGTAVRVSAEERDGRVRLVVADQGVGIPRRDLERIFERFYRVDRARSRETGGTGLGLAIVRHVATNHGGEIDVDSREGEGSVFAIVLPAVPAQGRRHPHGMSGTSDDTAATTEGGSETGSDVGRPTGPVMPAWAAGEPEAPGHDIPSDDVRGAT